MNLNSVITLTDETVTTVVCVPLKSGNTVPYMFKCKKRLAMVLKTNDIVVCDTKFGISLARVSEVHEESDIDPEAPYDYRWLFMLVEETILENLKNDEEAVRKSISSRRRLALRAKMRSLLQDDAVILEIPGS